VYSLSAACPPISCRVSVVPHFHALTFGPSFSNPVFLGISLDNAIIRQWEGAF